MALPNCKNCGGGEWIFHELEMSQPQMVISAKTKTKQRRVTDMSAVLKRVVTYSHYEKLTFKESHKVKKWGESVLCLR